jgi:hypothetical protein
MNQFLYSNSDFWRSALVCAERTAPLVRSAGTDIRILDDLAMLHAIAYKTAALKRNLFPDFLPDSDRPLAKYISFKKISLQPNEFIHDVIPGTGVMITQCQQGTPHHIRPFRVTMTLTCWDLTEGKKIKDAVLEYHSDFWFDVSTISLQSSGQSMASEGQYVLAFLQNTKSRAAADCFRKPEM